MRTCSGNNPHVIPQGREGAGRPTDWKKWSTWERAAVTDQDVTDFLCCLWRLADEGKKATGNSGNLPSGTFAEHVRQIARKSGLAVCETGKGWLLTEAGKNRVSGGKK